MNNQNDHYEKEKNTCYNEKKKNVPYNQMQFVFRYNTYIQRKRTFMYLLSNLLKCAHAIVGISHSKLNHVPYYNINQKNQSTKQSYFIPIPDFSTFMRAISYYWKVIK